MIDIFEVLGWLNVIDNCSDLSDEARRLSKSARVAGRSDIGVRALLDNLGAVSQSSSDFLEKAEISLNRAAVEYWRGWFPQAVHHAKEAVVTYKNDDHRRAVAFWILGMARWKMLENDKAYKNWDQARRLFNKTREFFIHHPHERSWYASHLKRMEMDLAARPEEILTWLNWFDGSDLGAPSEQLVKTVQEKIRQQAYPTAYALMQDLQAVNKSSKETYERAEVFFECGFAAYQMGNMASAIEWLKKAIMDFSPGIGNNHKQVVARCMLAAIEGMDECKRNQATADWRRCVEEFKELKLKADRDNHQLKKKWYADHLAILQAALSEWLPRTRPPRRKPERPTTTSPKAGPYQPNNSKEQTGLVQADRTTAIQGIDFEHSGAPHAESNPKKTASNNPKTQSYHPELYKELALLVHGDRATADSLIEYERKHFPQDNLNKLIERAIERLLRDRHAL